MKTKFSIFILATVLLSSCEDFINKQPLSDFTSEEKAVGTLESKYKSLSDAQGDLNGAYSKFKQDIFQLENFVLNDIQSDNCYLGSDEVAAEEFDNVSISPLNFKVGLDWEEYYGMAGSATTVIENTKLMTAGTITDADKQQIIAEAKFIRAYAYFDIVRLWGDAPTLLSLVPPITSQNIDEVYPLFYPARTKSDVIYDQIIKDLTEAEAVLPSVSHGAFKATKGATEALLAKVYATRGTKASRDYSKVVSYCDKVIGEGYQLEPEFDALWNADNKFTNESIFEIYFTSESPNWAYWVLLKEDDGSVTWRRYCTPTHELLGKYEQGDKRYASSFIFKEAPYEAFYPSKNYPFAYKIREKSSDIILIRLADILLLKAEALVEMNNVSSAMAIVNTIRTRAGIGALNTAMSQADARLAVENERQLELVLEAQRWFDLQRNDRVVAVMSKHKDKNGNLFIKKGVKSTAILLPIPQTEKDKNPNLTQNAGY
ncbi:MAG: RagB/SusD family nutrient uptake outer membrane protein [Bacteroidales bacterium]|nr:RagB/SusD family nutrient uptake outer membrane protein [Bacteroidales bacterium]